MNKTYLRQVLIWSLIIGTLLAILTTFITYIGYGLIIGATTVPNASGIVEEYNAWRYGYGGNISENVSLFTDCDRVLGVNENNESLFCEYGSANDQQVWNLS